MLNDIIEIYFLDLFDIINFICIVLLSYFCIILVKIEFVFIRLNK